MDSFLIRPCPINSAITISFSSARYFKPVERLASSAPGRARQLIDRRESCFDYLVCVDRFEHAAR